MYKSIRTVQFAFICVRGMSCLLTYNLCTQREYFVKEKRRNMTKIIEHKNHGYCTDAGNAFFGCY